MKNKNGPDSMSNPLYELKQDSAGMVSLWRAVQWRGICACGYELVENSLMRCSSLRLQTSSLPPFSDTM